MPNTEQRSRIRTDAGGGHRAANRVVDILELLATSADGLALRDLSIRYAGGVGDRRPLHATSSGKAILALLSPEEREEILRSLSLARHTERTVTSLPALRAALDEIRRSGVSLTVDEVMSGASGIAAAILDRHARVAGACAIGGLRPGSAQGSGRSPAR